MYKKGIDNGKLFEGHNIELKSILSNITGEIDSQLVYIY